MTMFRTGHEPQSRTLDEGAGTVYAYTFGFDLANTRTTPCTEQGQKAQYVYTDTVKYRRGGIGVGVWSHKHSQGTEVPVLAGGPIPPGGKIIVGMANFTNNDGDVVSLPVALSVDAGDVGDFIIGEHHGPAITAADTDINRPSCAWSSYDEPIAIAEADDIS